MFDFNNILNTLTPRDSFQYWFIRDGGDWRVEGKVEGDSVSMSYICNMSELDNQASDVSSSIMKDFERFKQTRPEYLFGIPLTVHDINSEHAGLSEHAVLKNAQIFDIILAGALLVRANSDNAIPTIERCLKWLHSTDFYSAPASTRYHESFSGGLVYHTLKVVNQVYDLLKLNSFSKVNVCEGVIVALTHDWCKIYLYEPFMRNVKDETTKKWNEVLSYRFRDMSTLPIDFLELRELGHGAGSADIARNFVKLNGRMRLAIRWHMGRWNAVDSEVNSLQWANQNEPLVHLIQFADQLATTNY